MRPVILIVDDEVRSRRSLKRLLRGLGYVFLEAESVSEAKITLYRKKVHVILLDLNMPFHKGNELLQHIKAHALECKVIVLTAHDDLLSPDEAIDFEVSDYLIKPVKQSTLRFVVERALGRVGIKTEKRIFLSYAREDLIRVKKYHKRLLSGGFYPWMDEEDLLPGQLWEYEILRAIQESDYFIALLSSKTQKDGFILKEITHALELKKSIGKEKIFLIPARIEECEIPYLLKDHQYVDLFKPYGFNKLVRALRTNPQQPR